MVVSKNDIYVAIEGLIGVGKSTLCDLAAPQMVNPIFQEKPETWHSLSHFYENPSRFAFMLQVEILSDFKELAKLSGTRPLVSERSARASTQVFAKMHVELGNLTKQQHQDLVLYETTYLLQPTHYIYLDLHPQLALQRIQSRGRACESKIDLQYLEKLNESYKKMLEDSQKPCFFIDASQKKESVALDFLEIMQKVNPEFLKRESKGKGF